jgi:hypothetical protein
MGRHLSVALLLAVAAHGQVRLHFGVEAGVPLTNTLSTSQILFQGDGILYDAYSSKTKLLLIGPTIRVELPLGLGVQFDALYQRVNSEQTHNQGKFDGLETFSHNTADRWQFPLLVQYRVKFPLLTPFIEAGPSVAHVANGHNTRVVFQTALGRTFSSIDQSNHLTELRHSTVAGVTAGLGVDLHPRFLHIRPEFRYVRWASAQFSALSPYAATNFFPVSPGTFIPVPAISSKRDEVDFLLGITF